MDIGKRDRTELKAYFVKNAIPTESNFSQLIDRVLNQKDDGIVKLPDDPLSIQASGSQKKAINFYESFADNSPAWVLSLNPRSDPSDPATAKTGFNIDDGEGKSRLFIDRTTGNVGIGTTTPRSRLDVAGDLAVTGSVSIEGTLETKARKGVYKAGTVPGDENWQTILTGGGHGAYELIANRSSGTGYDAMTHAIAVTTWGGSFSHPSITKTMAHNSVTDCRIDVRFGPQENYRIFELQVRAMNVLGGPITYQLTRLW